MPTPTDKPDETVTASSAAGGANKPVAMELAPTPEQASVDPEALPRPILERFDDIRMLGRGGMGTVYRAWDKQLQRDVALKLLHRHGPLASERVLREARAQARVEHEHVCKIHEVSVADGRPYIVMEYVKGEPLSAMGARLTLEEKVKLVRDAAAALHEAHRLGLVHRDVKPSNIMVERREDGAWKPYVMDFGLAREEGGQGPTMTGDVVGTPSFMAPEQARGEIRALDRRTDVYSLGATLYDMLAGHPPFTGSGVVQVLAKLLREDAPPLKEACPTVPEDLDKIVMKCLEREPPRRYESARALCEDLQRYLDGEPVLARRASLGYVLRKRARKHRLLLSLTSLSLLAATVLVGGWIRQRRLAAEEARLSRELGEDVKEMQLFMRAGYELPLHDVGRERNVVRQRLAEIERRMTTAGRAGEGPGNVALGRGYLALGESDKALSYLQRASAAGYASPELEYALGLSLVELYKVARGKLPLIVDKDKRAARQKEIEEQYRDPAVVHLKAARGATLENPAYVEGLIALYERRLDDALAKAKEAQAAVPWLYEAKLLEADILVLQGNKWRPNFEFNYDKMMQSYRPALLAYRSAADDARSDPAPYAGACGVLSEIIRAEFARGNPPGQSFEEAKLFCGRAIEANPEASANYISAAGLYLSVVPGELNNSPHPEKAIEEAIAHAEEAVRRNPDYFMAHRLLGQAWDLASGRAGMIGSDTRPPSDRSIAEYEEGLRLEPGDVFGLSEAGSCYSNRGEQESLRGLDPEPSFRRARELLDRADQVAPGFGGNAGNRASLGIAIASHLLASGRDPAAAVKEGVTAFDAMIKKSPKKCFAYADRAFLHVVSARYALASGGDPRPSLALAEQSIKSTPCPADGSPSAAGSMHATAALDALLRGEDPAPDLAKAREILRGNFEDDPNTVELRVELALDELIGIRWAMKDHKATPASFDLAFQPLRPLLEKDRLDPRPYEAMAEIYALRAAWLLESGKDPSHDLSEGLSMADKALSKNPHMATAHAAKGNLLLVSARSTRDERARRDAAGHAKEAFLAAFKENPLLEREHGPALKEAEKLGEAPAALAAGQ